MRRACVRLVLPPASQSQHPTWQPRAPCTWPSSSTAMHRLFEALFHTCPDSSQSTCKHHTQYEILKRSKFKSLFAIPHCEHGKKNVTMMGGWFKVCERVTRAFRMHACVKRLWVWVDRTSRSHDAHPGDPTHEKMTRGKMKGKQSAHA